MRGISAPPSDNKSRFSYCLFVLSGFLLLLSASCGKHEKAAGSYSRPFQHIYRVTSRYFDSGHEQRGIAYLDSAFRKLKSPIANDRFRFYAFHYLFEQRTRNGYKNALKYADSMLVTARQTANKQQYLSNFAEANFAKGDTYFSMEQYNDAYQCYFQSYLLAKSFLEKATLADYTFRMGTIMYRQERFKLATEYYQESYRLSPKGKENFLQFYRTQQLLDDIGISYRHSGELDSAMYYFNKDLHYLKAHAAEFSGQQQAIDNALGVVYGNQAELYLLRRQLRPARSLLQQSISINLKKGGDNRDAQFSEIKLAYLYNISHRNDSLFALLGTLRRQLDTIKNPYAEGDWNRLMGIYFQRTNQLKKAIRYTQQYNALKDSTIKQLSALKESDVKAQQANLEKQYEIDALNNNNKLQKIYLFVAILCSILMAVIIFLVWRGWSRSQLDVAVVISLNRQINQQKAELENTLAELKKNSLEKDRILRAVAHDLRNPLGGLAALTSILVDEYEQDKELALQLKLIRDTSNDSLELINELLEATHQEEARLTKQWVDVNALLTNSVELLRFKAAEKHQQIIVQGLSTGTELHVNREKMWRVLSNLISNAIKFSPVDATIKVKATEKQGKVVISVRDHGIGIPDQLKDKVFMMFTDAKRPGTAGEKSFGLGLSISRHIVENHEGRIWFESEQGKGSVFYVSIPKPVSPRPEAPADAGQLLNS